MVLETRIWVTRNSFHATITSILYCGTTTYALHSDGGGVDVWYVTYLPISPKYA